MIEIDERSDKTPEPTTIDEAARVAAKKLKWMAINSDAALYKFVKEWTGDCPQTDEFEFVFEGETFVAQVYNGGIYYVKRGEWDNVMIADKGEV